MAGSTFKRVGLGTAKTFSTARLGSWLGIRYKYQVRLTRLIYVALGLALVLCGGCGRSEKYFLEKAGSELKQGKLAEAELNFRKAIQKDGNDGEAWYKLGSVLVQQGKTPDAWSAFSRALELQPDREDAAVQLADLSLNFYKGDARRPKALYNKVTELADGLLSRNAESYDGLRLKAEIAGLDGKYSDAGELFSHANRVKPMQPEMVRDWAQVLFRDGQQQQAETLLRQLIGADKSYGPAYELLYRYYASAKRPGDAENILQSRVSNNPADAEAALRLAAHYAAASRESDMRAVLQRLLDHPKDFPQARRQVGDFYVGLRRWDDALAQYRQGLGDGAKEKTAYRKRIVDVLLAQGKGEEADKTVDEILKDNPGDESAQEVKASFLLATRKPENIDKAVSQLQALVQKDPENAERHFNLGRALAAKGDTNGAVGQFEAAVGKRPRFIEPQLALIEISQARGDYKSTLRYADRVLNLNPRLARIRLARAVALMNTGREPEGRREMETLERVIPNDRELQFQLGMLDLHERKLASAEARFRKLTPDDGGDGRAIGALVRTLAVENRVDDALAVIRQHIAKAPKSVVLHALLAKTAAETGRYDVAIGEYRQMLAAAPNSEQTALALGMTYRLKGDNASAVTYFQKARDVAPNDPEPIRRLAGALALSGRQKEAVANYRRALQLTPNDAVLLSNTAYLMAETGGNLDEAMNLAKKAIQLDPRQANFTDTLGWIYLRKHLNDSAAQVFRGLTDRYPNNPTFHYHLGMTLLQAGDKKAAGTELKAALAKKPSEEVRSRIQDALRATS
jgi:tetratricopeptide (TPR) repeat protein